MEFYKVLNSEGQDKHIDVFLSNDIIIENNNQLGVFQLETVKQNTNPIKDTEVEIFDPSLNYQINLNCLTTASTIFNTYVNNLYTEQEVRSGSDKFLKSFYLLEFYETTDPRLNKLVYTHRKYFRSLVDSSGKLIDLLSFNLNDLLLFISKNTTYSVLYLRVRLFNAKTGELKFFKTKNNDIYIKVILDNVNNIWSFENSDYFMLDEYKNPNELASIQNNTDFVPTQKYNTDKNKDYINTNGGYTTII
jgi:hypothetical protein